MAADWEVYRRIVERRLCVETVYGRHGTPLPRVCEYYERPRGNVVVVVRAAPGEVRHPQLSLGPSLDEDTMNVGWLSNACRKVRQVLVAPLYWCCGNNTFDEFRELERSREMENRREMLRSYADNSLATAVREDELRLKAGGDEDGKVTVSHRPRIVVSCVLALRVKLGTGAMDRDVPGNVALVRSEAAKMLRESNMRLNDMAAHLDVVEECFFEDTTHYGATRWRNTLATRPWIERFLYGKRKKKSVVA